MLPLAQRTISATMLLLLVAAGPAPAGDGARVSTDGEARWEYLYQDGQVQEAKWYDPQGRLAARTFYRDGRPVASEGYHGNGAVDWRLRDLPDERQEVLRFGPERRVALRYEAVAGRPDGPAILYGADGQPQREVTFRGGIADGPARTYHANGQIETEYAYRNGQLDGPLRHFAPDGRLLAEHRFESGRLQRETARTIK